MTSSCPTITSRPKAFVASACRDIWGRCVRRGTLKEMTSGVVIFVLDEGRAGNVTGK